MYPFFTSLQQGLYKAGKREEIINKFAEVLNIFQHNYLLT